MNPNLRRTLDSLAAGRVVVHSEKGNSMLPVIRSGQRQILVPVLDPADAERLAIPRYRRGDDADPGQLYFVSSDDLAIGDVVLCKVKGNVFTHEIVAIRGAGTEDGPEFQIAPHHRRHVNGWTRTVYGLCVRVED